MNFGSFMAVQGIGYTVDFWLLVNEFSALCIHNITCITASIFALEVFYLNVYVNCVHLIILLMCA